MPERVGLDQFPDLAATDWAVWADIDNDGWPELHRTWGSWCISGARWTNQIYHFDGDGKFDLMDIGEMRVGASRCTALVWADYDNDGWLDGLLGPNGPGDKQGRAMGARPSTEAPVDEDFVLSE